MFNKILVANRGEIAVRIIRACRELGVTACTVYSEADRGALHTRLADESYLTGSARPEDSYLNSTRIIEIALANNIDAIHPGYGFLAENADFIEKVENAGLTFIGPTSDIVRLMGDKIEARKFIKSIEVPYVPGTIEPTNNPEEVIRIANEIGFPVILKAAAGGGGKGMRIIEQPADIESALERAKSEAKKSFNDDKIYVEKYIKNPKHIEVQLLSDSHGNHRHLFERECSIQRRYQKIVEEAPSASVNPDLRKRITEAAVKIARGSAYRNAGTIEFLLDNEGNFYFLEMNTRLQVEHPVTEAITGIDIVKEQIRIAAGDKISYNQDELRMNGYAIECRINSEDPYNGFIPSSGVINYYSTLSGKDVRIDSGVDQNSEITLNYDSLLAKLIVHSSSRHEAIIKMKNAIKEYKIAGVLTNLPVHLWVLDNSDFLTHSHGINTLEQQFNPVLLNKLDNNGNSEVAAAIGVYLKDSKRKLKTVTLFNSESNKWIEHD